MVSGKPYISVNSATMKAEKAPKDRQSRLAFGFVKLKAKMTNTAVSMITSPTGHRPEPCHASSAMFPFVIRPRPRRLTVAAVMAMVHEDVHQRTGEDQEPGQHAKDMRGVLRQ